MCVHFAVELWPYLYTARSRVGQPRWRARRHVPNRAAGPGGPPREPVADHSLQPRLYECARPTSPALSAGHKMLHCYPYVPVGGEMAVNCAILSYNGTVYFGFSGDTHAAPDLRRLEKLLQGSFVELRDTVALRPPRTRKAIRKHRSMSSVATGPSVTTTSPFPIPRPAAPDSKLQSDSAAQDQREKAPTEFIVA